MDNRRRARGRRIRGRSVNLKRHMAEEFAKLSDEIKKHILDQWRNLQEKRRKEQEKLADDIATALGWRMIEGRVFDRHGREIVGYDKADGDGSTRLKP
jgi:hypothetical protein